MMAYKGDVSMAKAKRAILSSAALIRVVTGFFFVILGLTGILPESEGLFSLSSDRTTLEIIFGVIEILCGALSWLTHSGTFPEKPLSSSFSSFLACGCCAWSSRNSCRAST
jgi:hypothetical protein